MTHKKPNAIVGVTNLPAHKRSSMAIIGVILLYLADRSDWISEASETVLICGTILFGLFIVSQTILDGIRIWKGTHVEQ